METTAPQTYYHSPFNTFNLIVISPFQFQTSSENLVLDQDNNIYLISLSILITNLLSNIWIL